MLPMPKCIPCACMPDAAELAVVDDRVAPVPVPPALLLRTVLLLEPIIAPIIGGAGAPDPVAARLPNPISNPLPR